MQSVIEISISGDTFLFLNNMSLQQLERVKFLSEQFRMQQKSSKITDTHLILDLFCAEVEQTLGIKLYSVSIMSVITLK